jgi:putative transposase
MRAYKQKITNSRTCNNYKTITQAKTAVFEYIETWYNTKRLHSVLDYKTPKEIELEFMNIKNAA